MQQKWSVKKLTCTALLAAVAGVLMSLEFSVPLMPVFYKVDFSDVPTVIALFAMGPASGLGVELIKLLIKVAAVGTNSNFVGEFANLIGAFLFILPIWLISKKTGLSKRGTAVTLALSGVIRIAWSCFCNAFITLPLYAASFGLPLEEVIRTVSAANPAITSLTGFIIMATIPFNLLKYALNYLAAHLLYHRAVPALFPTENRPAQKADTQKGRI